MIEPRGRITELIESELPGYELDIDFQPGDIVIDIGAHIGIVSCDLALKHPEIDIRAYEPIPENFAALCRNIEANGIKNVHAFNYAITGDGRDVELYGNLEYNSGGSSIYGKGSVWVCPSLSLRTIMPDKLRLLKIDCEGSEYDILNSSKDLLPRIESLRGEFHIVPGEDEQKLIDLVSVIPDVHLTLHEPLSFKEAYG